MALPGPRVSHPFFYFLISYPNLCGGIAQLEEHLLCKQNRRGPFNSLKTNKNPFLVRTWLG